MKKLLSDTEITILRDVIKLKPRRPPPEKVDTEGETLVSTTGTGTGTDDFEDAQDTVDAESKETKEEEEEQQQEEQEEVEGGGGEEEEKEAEDEEPDTSQVGCFIHYV